MIKRANLTPEELAKHRFRFRVRFERPAGGGIWHLEKTLFGWLDSRLGKGNYVLHGDKWDGHGLECYALQFDDHAIIPELLAHYEGIRTELSLPPRFVATIPKGQGRAIRSAIAGLQSLIVDKMNATEPRVVWTMGHCTMIRGAKPTVGENLQLGRIQSLTQVDLMFAVTPPDGPYEIVLEDHHRSAMELSVVMALDRNAAPEDVAPVRMLLGELTQIKADSGS